MASPPKVSIKERQRKLREEAIVEAARDLLLRKGYAATTLDEMIAEVGVSRSTLYQHFASKEEIMVAVVVRMIVEAHAHLRSLASSMSPKEAVEAFFLWAFDLRFDGKRTEYFRVAVILAMSTHDAIRLAEGEIVAELSELIGLAQREGAMSPKSPPYLVARILISVLRDPFYESAFQNGQLDMESMKTNLIELLLDA